MPTVARVGAPAAPTLAAEDEGATVAEGAIVVVVEFEVRAGPEVAVVALEVEIAV